MYIRSEKECGDLEFRAHPYAISWFDPSFTLKTFPFPC
jgi:hypothetical protein